MSKKLRDLVHDLWWFIENVSDDTPDRTDRFFALRESVRESGVDAATTVSRALPPVDELGRLLASWGDQGFYGWRYDDCAFWRAVPDAYNRFVIGGKSTWINQFRHDPELAAADRVHDFYGEPYDRIDREAYSLWYRRPNQTFDSSASRDGGHDFYGWRFNDLVVVSWHYYNGQFFPDAYQFWPKVQVNANRS